MDESIYYLYRFLHSVCYHIKEHNDYGSRIIQGHEMLLLISFPNSVERSVNRIRFMAQFPAFCVFIDLYSTCQIVV